MKTNIVKLIIVTSAFVLSHISWAQFDETPGASRGGQGPDSEVEGLYEVFDQREQQRTEGRLRQQRQRLSQPLPSLGELSTLAPFEDIAVIQRRFLPKTQRFELTASGATGLNNPFFNSVGVAARASYYFRERYGVELIYMLFANTQRAVTRDLAEERSIDTKTLVTARNFMGAAFRWNPIYGKVTWFNQRIIPFDFNFAVGGGVTETESGSTEPTIHLSTGQVFAISKSLAFRWDLNWNFYQAQSQLQSGLESKSNQDDLLLAFGLSFFFPEAAYR